MNWRLSHRADPSARVLADRHYNRQSIGADQFVPPGRCIVLVIPGAAFWVTSWPFAEYVKHAWAGAWVCSAFRNERRDLYLSSSLILDAISANATQAGSWAVLSPGWIPRCRRDRRWARCAATAARADAGAVCADRPNVGIDRVTTTPQPPREEGR